MKEMKKDMRGISEWMFLMFKKCGRFCDGGYGGEKGSEMWKSIIHHKIILKCILEYQQGDD